MTANLKSNLDGIRLNAFCIDFADSSQTGDGYVTDGLVEPFFHCLPTSELKYSVGGGSESENVSACSTSGESGNMIKYDIEPSILESGIENLLCKSKKNRIQKGTNLHPCHD